MLITARRLGCGLEHLCGPGVPGENRQSVRGLEEEEEERDPGGCAESREPSLFPSAAAAPGRARPKGRRREADVRCGHVGG